VRTLAASGVKGFKQMHKAFQEISPLRRPILPEDCGNAAKYLCSDLSRAVTGEVIYVDGGYNVIGVPNAES
jgi:enoyl-[acyl-carrier protein] reductase I